MGKETTMVSRLVVLKLDGDLETSGFQVTLDVAQEEPFSSISFPQLSKNGYLPPSPKLADSLSRWIQDYGDLTEPSRGQKSRTITPKKIQVSGSINPLIEVCKTSSEALATLFRKWLRTDSFRDIEMALREVFDRQNAIRVLIRTQAHALHLLPWHLWPLIQDYPNAEVAMGAHQFKDERQSLFASTPETQVRILAVLGNDENIDVGADRRLLNALPGAQVTLLVKPTLETFNDQLYEKRWDILFFAGHSKTADGQGVLQLNFDTMLTISQVEYGMRRAIANGLQLAVFNSCSGVGLAYALEQLDLPQMIVMRQAVPDYVAHEFLKHFLKAFSQGCSFYQAEREARERLQGLEQDFPCASWLPVIYQHPAKVPPNWQQLQCSTHKTTQYPSQQLSHPSLGNRQWTISKKQKVVAVAIASTIVTGLVVSVRFLGMLQSLELKAYDHLIRIQPKTSIPDLRISIIGIDGQDIQYQDDQGMNRSGSLSDQALEQLLQKLLPYQPSVIGLDILHEYPFSDAIIRSLESHNFVAICQSSNALSGLEGTKSASNLSDGRLGFNNTPLDIDGIIRRQFLGKAADTFCPVNESFNFRIAHLYLQEKHDIEMEWTSSPSRNRKYIRLGQQVFKPLQPNSGGYRLPEEEASGYQILMNYRVIHPEVIQLREILSGAVDTQLEDVVTDKIILVGVVDRRDRHATSYSDALNPIPGVIVQAQMMSQIIDAALGKRPILSWWPEWVEVIWIVGWSLMGTGGVALMGRSPRSIVLIIVLGSSILWGISLFLFTQGWWIPFIPSLLSFSLSGACMASVQIRWVSR